MIPPVLADSALLVASVGALYTLSRSWRDVFAADGAREVRAAFERTSQCLVILDARGDVLQANRAWLTLTGLVGNDIIGQCWWELACWSTTEARQSVRNLFDTASRGGAAHEVVSWQLGEVDIDLQAVHDRRGEITRLVVDARDVTARRRLEEQLSQAQRMDAMGQMAGGVAHDFNNLLMVISGHSSILIGQLPASDPRHAHVKSINSAAQQAAWLTERLLAFSRRAVQVPKVMNVNTAIRETERMLRRVIRENVQLRVMLDPKAGQVRIDPGQWSQLLMNLVVNARDAMPHGGTLVIRSGRISVNGQSAEEPRPLHPGAYVTLSVTDSGTGIPDDIRQRIFEPFFTTKDVGHGTGLGLAVVHGIVTQAGGRIDVESALGQGTTFTVHLPAIDELPDTSTLDHIPRRIGAGERILLVEDEPAVRDVVAIALREQGFEVLAAGDGPTALQIVQAEGHIDLLATDVVMPHMSGRELADTLEARLPGLRVLFMSGYADDVRLQGGALRTDEEYLQKPFPLGTLALKVREMIDRP